MGTYYDECYKEALAQIAKDNQESELEYLKTLENNSKTSAQARKEKVDAREKADAERYGFCLKNLTECLTPHQHVQDGPFHD